MARHLGGTETCAQTGARPHNVYRQPSMQPTPSSSYLWRVSAPTAILQSARMQAGGEAVYVPLGRGKYIHKLYAIRRLSRDPPASLHFPPALMQGLDSCWWPEVWQLERWLPIMCVKPRFACESLHLEMMESFAMVAASLKSGLQGEWSLCSWVHLLQPCVSLRTCPGDLVGHQRV